MTARLDEAHDFVILYVVLLGANIIWLGFSATFGIKVGSDNFFTIFEELQNVSSVRKMLPQQAVRKWAYNNTISVVLLVIVLITLTNRFGSDLTYLICSIIMLVNCVVDLITTWSFYLPKFGDAYAAVEQAPVPPGQRSFTEAEQIAGPQPVKP